MGLKNTKHNIPNATESHLGCLHLVPIFSPILALVMFFGLSVSVNAQIVITEVMYDLEVGSDSGREWVEVCNTASVDVNISGWKFFENNTNHGLNMVSGSENISSGEFAVFADNPEKFLIDWPGFSGNLFDSAFSLSNTGETIEIRNADLVTEDIFVYTNELGASGDGNSLHKSDASIMASSANPGSGTCKVVNYGGNESSGGNEDPPSDDVEQNTATASSSYSVPVAPNIKVDAGRDMVGIVGADISFVANTIGLKGKPIDAERYLWSFGDGARGEGKKITHAFNYPGNYIVYLDVASGKYSTSDKLNVNIVPADIFVSKIGTGPDGFVEITNDTKYEISLSRWMISDGNKIFTIPENTFIKSKNSIKFASSITGLNISIPESVLLMYSNGLIVKNNSQNLIDSVVNQNIVDSNVGAQNEEIVKTKQENMALQSENISVKSEYTDTEIVDADDDFGVLEKDQAASARSSRIDLKWIMSLFSLIVVGSVAVVFLRKDLDSSDQKKDGDGEIDFRKIAKKFEIIDKESESL
ncbi:hypothetical protein COW81_00325 [Candidatus Campbellbacteria bacterium CG22_combo_CG10-13_8_21_14_all_36_13]|uniref:PKD domain-containing protein n=1 Tax=Candidatus Campbellbacteria bacterium CG22_combo_CG10-13_8_21_14_all_36_13 TaxID=1974529 RepID=A0A2H0E0R0_9BACT|nr:MAG: hypothetical protein COW81_00325 [Candidatus Campbellbacteria bacterium CG22_combo_CG10-13_8_21_14_all_36_13]